MEVMDGDGWEPVTGLSSLSVDRLQNPCMGEELNDTPKPTPRAPGVPSEKVFFQVGLGRCSNGPVRPNLRRYEV